MKLNPLLVTTIAALILVVFLGMFLVRAGQQCAAKGGVNIKTSSGYSCVKLEVIR